MFGKISFWLVLLLLLSAPAGWHLAEKNKERKAIEQAEADRLRELARIEQARLDLERLRNQVKADRESGVGQHMENVVLKNNKKPLSNVSIKAFNDDGITFNFNSLIGSARVPWADLPDDLVTKYRDPVTAKEAEAKASQEAASLAAVENIGQKIRVSFVRELTEAENTNGMRGSIVKVLTVFKDGSRDGGGKRIFVINLSKAFFDNNPIQELRVYPVGRSGSIIKKDTAVIENEKTPVYAGTAEQAYQIARQDGMSITELAKIKL
jgi:hypothetical protein